MPASDVFFSELKKLNLLFIVDDIQECKYDVEMFKSFFNCVDIINKKNQIKNLNLKKYDLITIKLKRKEKNFLTFIKSLKEQYPYLYIAVILEKFKKKRFGYFIKSRC